MKDRIARKAGPMRRVNTLQRRVKISKSWRQRPVAGSVEKRTEKLGEGVYHIFRKMASKRSVSFWLVG